MLVRALNVLRFFLQKKHPHKVIATAALDQPGDEGWAYGRTLRNSQHRLGASA
jgi:hypothetical protein